MSRDYSQDLRDRVLDAVLEKELSAHAAAERFGIGVATAFVWVRHARETGLRAAKPGGQPKGSKLDLHREAILGWVDAKADIAIAEMRERLSAEHDVTAGVGTIWEFLNRCGLTFKKRARMPASRTGRTSASDAKTGSKTSQTSTCKS